MAAITVVDREGEKHVLDATPGWSVMEIIREHDLPIEAACGYFTKREPRLGAQRSPQ